MFRLKKLQLIKESSEPEYDYPYLSLDKEDIEEYLLPLEDAGWSFELNNDDSEYWMNGDKSTLWEEYPLMNESTPYVGIKIEISKSGLGYGADKAFKKTISRLSKLCNKLVLQDRKSSKLSSTELDIDKFTDYIRYDDKRRLSSGILILLFAENQQFTDKELLFKNHIVAKPIASAYVDENDIAFDENDKALSILIEFEELLSMLIHKKSSGYKYLKSPETLWENLFDERIQPDLCYELTKENELLFIQIFKNKNLLEDLIEELDIDSEDDLFVIRKHSSESLFDFMKHNLDELADEILDCYTNLYQSSIYDDVMDYLNDEFESTIVNNLNTKILEKKNYVTPQKYLRYFRLQWNNEWLSETIRDGWTQDSIDSLMSNYSENISTKDLDLSRYQDNAYVGKAEFNEELKHILKNYL